ncbi:MAG: formiminotransferase-cyclodeaminase [Deltaproteobacteria bacterium]|nr:MAG: formiminotransferase-cyclodeaminase [Deltaproteobacteria bacterium]
MEKDADKRGIAGVEKNIDTLFKILSSTDNTTGGGSASSIAGAMAAGLVGMVARLSLGKTEPELDETYQEVATEADALVRNLFAGATRDSDAFAVVSDAFSLPKGTDEEKKIRSQKIAAGMTLCAEVPLENAQLCRRVYELHEILEKRYNTNASSDLACAKNLAIAGVRGCAENVKINLPYLKDEEKVKTLTDRLHEIVSDIE